MKLAKNKILFVSHDATMTGAPILLLNLAKLLVANTISVGFILKYGGILEKDFREHYFCKIASYKKPNNLFNRVINKIYRQSTFNLDNIQWSSYDLIISNTITNGDILPLIREHYKGPILSYIHELATAANLYTNQENIRNLIAITNHFLVPCAAVKAFLVEAYKIKQDTISILPYYIPAKHSAKNEKVINEFIIGGAGYVEWRKGCDLFVLIAKEVITRLPACNVKFFWRGAQSDIELDRLQHDINKVGLTDKIQFLPPSANMKDFYDSLSMFLLTSREDPYPLVVLEAANAAVPTVCFKDAGGSPEFITKCNGGKCLDYLDVEGMATAIVNYYNNKLDRINAGFNAKEEMERTHQNPEFIFSKFQEIVNKQIEQS